MPGPASAATESAAAGPGRLALSLQRLGRRAARLVPLGLLYGVLAILVVVPIAFVAYASLLDEPLQPGSFTGSLSLDNFSSLFRDANLVSIRNSLIIGVVGTAIAVAIGASLAWLVARSDIPARRLIRFAAIAPLFMSTLVAALAWDYLGAPNQGFINVILRDLGIGLHVNFYSLGGIILVLALYYAPYSFLLVHSGLAVSNPELEQAARVHGASFKNVMRYVTLPLIGPTLIGATLLTFVLIIENFAVPQILGTPGQVSTLPSYIYRLMSEAPPRSNIAAAVSMFLLLLVAIVVFQQQRLVARRSYAAVTGRGLRPQRVALGRWKWPALGLVVTYITLTLVLPLVALLEISLRDFSFFSSAADLIDTEKFTLANFDTLLSHDNFWPTVVRTLLAAGLAAVVGCALYFIVSYAVHRTRLPGRGPLEYIAMAPLGIPALILGLGFFWTWLVLPVPLYGTLWVLIVVFVAAYMPYGVRSTSAGMLQIHRELEESARVSGAGPLRVARHITIPLIRSGMVAAALLVVVMAVREFSAVIFLHTADTHVMATLLFNTWRDSGSNETAALSLCYVVLLGVLAGIASRWMDLGGRRGGGSMTGL